MKSITPVVKPPIVDRLAFVLPWGLDPDADQSKLIAPVRLQIAKAIEAGRCERAYPKGGRYRENFRIKLNGGNSAFVQIGALQPSRQKGGIRIMVNPARFASGDAEQLNRVMQRIVGTSYNALLRRPLLNNIDFAVDVTGACLDRILVAYSNAQRHTMFGKRINAYGHIEGYNFGSLTSDYMVVAYNKSQERVHAAILALVKSGIGTESLKSNAVKQLKRVRRGPHVMRVEVRGKKMRGLRLSELNSLPNRFARFRFADLNAAGMALPELTELSFLALCRDSGVKAALAAFKHTEHARQVHAYWRSRQAAWWQPEPLWQQACEAVCEIGLFPDDAFAPLK
jgi:hypothetical protein